MSQVVILLSLKSKKAVRACCKSSLHAISKIGQNERTRDVFFSEELPMKLARYYFLKNNSAQISQKMNFSRFELPCLQKLGAMGFDQRARPVE